MDLLVKVTVTDIIDETNEVFDNYVSTAKHPGNTLFAIALCITVMSLLSQILTIFTATVGPAKAATWATTSFLWDFLESTTGAIGDACGCVWPINSARALTE
jgi:hypothetical protein